MLLNFFTGLGILTIIGILGLVFLMPLIALIDILRNEFTHSNKIIWVITVIFFPFLGAILYFLLGGNHKIRKP